MRLAASDLAGVIHVRCAPRALDTLADRVKRLEGMVDLGLDTEIVQELSTLLPTFRQDAYNVAEADTGAGGSAPPRMVRIVKGARRVAV